ncbi:MAG: NAD-dependent epimerase/dehydratase family protein [Acidimicrobiaceae bacterium]|nr:NAD-dependent epimerase/dehydratase family protein [Acidimicrobiaceae bacterium]MXY11294.1 NAD-dependent epimerase/dehydratase family protein [Acidimicrobiaceae bacterium]MXZ65376.1 NAD-dependent epimerase/dehydratase family protein [Acidimicrobiaceae bacterium]MYE56432.1 NAD-dependent epimerase/dehydratase family protein [Acidimicrobiaceae bacterium]MYF34404.1 NAD-dependent epimerase/dehydratase family protein [Acidimicrobiaceae bacterium]
MVSTAVEPGSTRDASRPPRSDDAAMRQVWQAPHRVSRHALSGLGAVRRVRALVTGASGFVGCHLVAHLAACGDEVTTSEAEITDPEALEADFEGCRPDAVYHLAAQADVKASFTAAAATLRVNVEGTFNVLDAARRAGAGRVVVVSSADVYGRLDPDELPVGEATPMRPVTPYGASKAAAEMVCVQAGAARGLDVVRARAFNHLGPGQSDRFVAAALAVRIAQNERTGAKTVPVGNLKARRDFTDVRDVVRAYRLLAERGVCGEAYNVCSGTSLSVRDLADALMARARHPMRLTADDELFRPVDVAEVRGDPSKLRAATGWSPEVELEQTLDELLDYWRDLTPESELPPRGDSQ